MKQAKTSMTRVMMTTKVLSSVQDYDVKTKTLFFKLIKVMDLDANSF